MKTIRIGAGAGFSGDRIEPAVELAKHGSLDYLVFECLAERTIALAQLRKQSGKDPGYDPLLRERLSAVLIACRKNGTCIISNMGAANPRAAAVETVQIARELGLAGLRVAYVEGDDVLGHFAELAQFEDDALPPGEAPISANAYIGHEAIVEALKEEADVVLTGRVADPSLFLAPLVFAFGWSAQDWALLGQGTAVGHLLECAGQLTGGYFADPGFKTVPDLENIGFPIATINEDGNATFEKLVGTGGILTLQTCREQILYEVMDPARYMTPDVCADFSQISLQQRDFNVVTVTGGSGSDRPDHYKVSVGYRNGFFGESQISYAGSGALARAELAREVLRKRLQPSNPDDLRFDLIGVNSIHGQASVETCLPCEVRLRVTGRFPTEAEAQRVPREVESLYVNGPSGGCGVASSIRESIAIYPALLRRNVVQPTVSYEVA